MIRAATSSRVCMRTPCLLQRCGRVRNLRLPRASMLSLRHVLGRQLLRQRALRGGRPVWRSGHALLSRKRLHERHGHVCQRYVPVAGSSALAGDDWRFESSCAGSDAREPAQPQVRRDDLSDCLAIAVRLKAAQRGQPELGTDLVCESLARSCSPSTHLSGAVATREAPHHRLNRLVRPSPGARRFRRRAVSVKHATAASTSRSRVDGRSDLGWLERAATARSEAEVFAGEPSA
jgi:hypothetical protein